MTDTKQSCENCLHHRGGTRPICEIPLPWWAEPHERPAVYNSEGTDCESWMDRNNPK